MVQLWVQALFFGLFSAISLPIGSLLGVFFAPVSAKNTARWMAFGSGALVFAVATQLFGDTLFRIQVTTWPTGVCGKLCQQHCRNTLVQVVCSMLGAFLYLALNRLLEKMAKSSPPPAVSSRSVSLREATPAITLRTPAVEGILQRAVSEIEASPIACLTSLRRASSVGPAQVVSSSAQTNACVAEEDREISADSHGHGGNVALSMWLGMMLDGIPEALMLGFMTNENSVTLSFLIAIVVANFPEAFSGASILHGQRMPLWQIYGMWILLCLLTGLLSMVGSLIMPVNVEHGSSLEIIRDRTTSAMQGLTGGAMLAMVSTAMLPEAFKGAGEFAGVLFVFGFGLSVVITAIGFRYGNPW